MSGSSPSRGRVPGTPSGGSSAGRPAMPAAAGGASGGRGRMSGSRPAAPDPGRWRVVLLLALLAIGIPVTIALRRCGQELDLPRLSAAAVAGLAGDEADERRLMVHLTGCLYRGKDLDSWRELGPPARHAWATITVEDRVVHGPMPSANPGPDGAPALADAADGYAAFGAEAMAALLRARIAGTAEHFHQDFTRLLPAARQARLAYLHANAAAVAAGRP